MYMYMDLLHKSKCHYFLPFEKECTVFLFSKQFLSPLHPNISIHILHTVLCTLILTGADKDWRIFLTIKSFFS